MSVITIARQFGAGGTSVGQILARKLQADLLDRQLIAEVARRLEMPEDEVEAQDEQPGSFLNRLLIALGSWPVLGRASRRPALPGSRHTPTPRSTPGESCSR